MNQIKTNHSRLRAMMGSIILLASSLPLLADSNVTNSSRNQNEPMLAINPVDHNRVVCGYNSYQSGWKTGWSYSDDGGDDWTYGGLHTLVGYDSSADPVICFSSTGDCFYAGLAFNYISSSVPPEDGSIFVATSPDGGETFNTPVIIATGSGITDYLDKPWMYSNPYNDHIYLAWVKRVNFRDPVTEEMSIWFCRSTNGGASYSTPIKISDFSPETGTNRCHGPQITATSADDVFVSWHTVEEGDPVDTSFRIFVTASTNGGTSFGANYEAVEAEYGKPTIFISMDADQNTGRIYITYCDSPVSDPRNYEVYVISSTSAAGPWSAPVRVNDFTFSWQFWPALDVSPEGRVDVAWYDRRSSSSETEVFYSSSDDGGLTWSTNEQVSSPSTGFRWPWDFAGDYLSVASVSEKTVIAWMDNRDAGTGYDRQDIYASIEWTEFLAPTLLTPTGGVAIEDNLPTFTWYGYGDSYTIEIATDPAFNNVIESASFIYHPEYTPSDPLDFSDYTYQPGGGGSHDPNYYWRVKARYDPSDESEFSAIDSFIVTGPAEVPSEYSTISAARGSFPLFIGGTVLVAPGTYTGPGNRSIGMGGERPVDIIATDGPEVTIIDCQGSYSGFVWDLYTIGNPEVNGFTVRNAWGSGDDLGAFVFHTGWGTVRNCTVEISDAPGVKAFRGGGADVYNTIIRGGDEGVVVTSGGSLNMVGCEIYNQWGWCVEAHSRDGGDANSVVIDSCLFYDNSQGDIIIWGAGTVDISNTTILPAATGLWFYAGTDVSTVSNTIVAFSPYSGVRWYQTDNTVTFDCCDFYGNSNGDWTDRAAAQLGLRGNIAEDPQFCDTAAGIYGLLSTSPCTEANSGCGGMGAFDVCQGYTPPGANVEVDVSDEVTVVFEQVTSAGITTVEVLDPGDTETPADFSVVPTTAPVLYQVSTTATVSGQITICFQYDEGQVVGSESALRLLHSDGTLPITWDDITILPVDVLNNIICGNPPSLSPFIMGFWCCGMYTPSNVTGNTNCSQDGLRTLADITRLIDRVYISKLPLCCEGEGNTDGSLDDKITLADITRLIDHVYISKVETAICP